MTIAHRAVEAHSCTFEVWDGDIDEAEVRAHLLRLADDPEWPPGLLNLVDLTTTGAITIPDPELVAVLREGTILESELKTALIVRPELMEISTPPAYEESARATGVTTFSDLHSASAHLGIEPKISRRLITDLRQSL